MGRKVIMDFNFQENLEQAEKKYNLGKGEYFKPQEGANRIRLVSVCLPHESVFKGRINFKWLCQVLDRKDGKVKPYFMPHTIYRFITDLQFSEDYRFSGVPMPYDVTINANGAGSKEVKYSLIPNKPTELTAEEQNLITDAPTIKELQRKVLENAKKTEQVEETEAEEVEPVEPIDTSDLPF